MRLSRTNLGEVVELHCEFDPESRSGLPGASRKVKGTIHWVSAVHGVPVEVRLCDRLFTVPNPLADKSRDFLEFLNPHSLDVIEGAVVEVRLWLRVHPVIYISLSARVILFTISLIRGRANRCLTGL